MVGTVSGWQDTGERPISCDKGLQTTVLTIVDAAWLQQPLCCIQPFSAGCTTSIGQWLVEHSPLNKHTS
jgi:hypothetical protein